MLRYLDIFPLQEDGSRLLIKTNDVRGITSDDTGAPVVRETNIGRFRIVVEEKPETILVRTTTTVLFTPKGKKL